MIELSDEIRAAHQDLSEHNLAFTELAVADPEVQKHANFASLQDREHLAYYNLQDWPTFIGRRKIEEFERVAVGLDRICRDIPYRVFDGDVDRIAEFYDLDRDFAERILRPPTGGEEAVSRGDYILTESGLKMLEFNFGSGMGGWHMETVAPLYLGHPLIASFLAERGLRACHHNTVRAYLSHIAGVAAAAGLHDDGKLNLAFTIRPNDPGSSYAKAIASFLPALTDVFRSSDFYEEQMRLALEDHPEIDRSEVLLCSHGDFEVRDGATYLGDKRVHAIGDQVDLPTRAVFDCFKSGGVGFYTGPFGILVSNKLNLALLSDPEILARYAPKERRLIEDHIPWSRMVKPETVSFRGSETRLPDLLAAEPKSFVLKKDLGLGGLYVRVGRFLTGGDWTDAVRLALDEGGWMVQEYVESRPYVHQYGELGCAPHNLVWGFFVMDDRYSGGFLRMLAKDQSGIINMSQGATVGLIVEVEEA